jgi:hypothetical protein
MFTTVTTKRIDEQPYLVLDLRAVGGGRFIYADGLPKAWVDRGVAHPCAMGTPQGSMPLALAQSVIDAFPEPQDPSHGP